MQSQLLYVSIVPPSLITYVQFLAGILTLHLKCAKRLFLVLHCILFIMTACTLKIVTLVVVLFYY
jgi:hypothetical protein